MEFEIQFLKDLGLKREVMDALPYAVVGGAHEGSLWYAIALNDHLDLLSYVVPAGHQLKILFLRVSTTDILGALFRIVQTNPSALGQTGAVEAFPVVGNVPPFAAGATAVRDYPMLEAAGAEVLRGSLKDPIHVLEGSVDFELLGAEVGPANNRYGLTWWGVIDIPEAHP
jgi:hypothetical protein